MALTSVNVQLIFNLHLEDAVRNLEAVELIAKTMKKNELAADAKTLRLKISG
jgi:superfamily II helicase